jgi:hypothetical protein
VLETTGHWNLTSAEQRNIIPAKLTCGEGGMLGIQIFGNGEEDAGDVVNIKLIPHLHGGKQLAGGLQNLLTIVSSDGSSAAQSTAAQ